MHLKSGKGLGFNLKDQIFVNNNSNKWHVKLIKYNICQIKLAWIRIFRNFITVFKGDAL